MATRDLFLSCSLGSNVGVCVQLLALLMSSAVAIDTGRQGDVVFSSQFNLLLLFFEVVEKKRSFFLFE